MSTLDPVKVLYMDGDECVLTAKGRKGWLSADETKLSVSGDRELSIPLRSVRGISLESLQLGHLVRVRHDEGSLLLGITRLNLWGHFVILNYPATRRLADTLRELLS